MAFVERMDILFNENIQIEDDANYIYERERERERERI
jgi:hypothetical protein